MKTRVSLEYFCELLSLEAFFLILTRPRPIQTYFFDIFGNSKAFHTFNLKLEQLSGKEVLTFALLVNCFPDLFIAVEISY